MIKQYHGVWTSDHASIDPTFNAICPRGVVLQRDLSSLLGRGPWPVAMLAPFMHELTHHWCFYSTVGNVLASINLRSCETAIFGCDDGAEFACAAHDHLTFRAVMEFLRPLCEGMALFAEFDSRPGRASVVSDPQHFAWIACAEGSVSSERQLSAGAAAALRTARTSPEGTARKTEILTHPASDSRWAYFDGYLMVKSLHHSMCRIVPQAKETDWFLCYLRDYVFSDPGLVRTILEDPPDGMTKLDAVIGHVANRLWGLLRVTEDDARAYETFVSQQSTPDPAVAWPNGIGVRDGDADVAQAHIADFAEWFVKPCDAERQFWRHFVGRVLKHRTIAVAAAEQVPLKIANRRVAALITGSNGGMSFYQVGALDPSEPDRTATGWIVVLLRLGHAPLIATALGDATKVLALITRPQDAANDPQACSLLLDELIVPPVLGEYIAMTNEAHRLLRTEAARRFGGTEAEAHARRQATRVACMFIDMMSKDWCYGWDLDPESDFGRGRPCNIFKDTGVWALFAPNQRMLNLYVRATAGARLSPAEARKLKAFAVDVEKRFGIRLIEYVSGKITFWL